MSRVYLTLVHKSDAGTLGTDFRAKQAVLQQDSSLPGTVCLSNEVSRFKKRLIVTLK